MQEHLKQIVYGGNDGMVTTFAVVAGFAGHGAEGSAAVAGAAEPGLFTFVGFVVFGLAPLLPCFVRAPVPATFAVSVAAIGGAAALAGHQADAGRCLGETLLVGGLCAAVAYAVGRGFRAA